MRLVFIRWFILTFAIIITSSLIGGISVEGFFSAFFAAAVLSTLNTFLRPLFFLLFFPVMMFTFGIFLFVINAFLLLIISGIIPGFEVNGFWSAIFGSVIITIVSWLLSVLLHGTSNVPKETKRTIDLKKTDNDHWE